MKKVISGNELLNVMQESINLLCDTVKITLGPIGNNVIIDSDEISPYITNDGVTIAQNIESDDPVINTILNIAKEASIKTNEMVGDGTTTTLVLLQSLFNQGLSVLNEISSIELKKEMDMCLDNLIPEIKKESWLPNKDDFYHLATISSGDETIGKLVSELYMKMNQRGSIKIKEHNGPNTYSEIITGYAFDSGVASDYFLKNQKELSLKNPYVLVLKGYLENIYMISEIINALLETKRDLIIIASDVNDAVIQEFIVQNYQNDFTIALVIAPDYASRKNDILNDISIFTNASIVDFNFQDTVRFENLGVCEEVKLSNTETLILANHKKTASIEKRIEEIEIKIEEEQDDYEKEFLLERIAKLKNGIGMIYVGAQTMTERREKKMRFDDALCALESAKNGVLPGEGLSLLKISGSFTYQTKGEMIIQESLLEPSKQIFKNMGLNEIEIINSLKEKNYNMLYNFKTNDYETRKESKIIDSCDVVIHSLKNAVSIASMLLTTTHLVVNEKSKNLNQTEI